MRNVLFSALVSFALAAIAPAHAQQTLSGAEAKAFVAGKTFKNERGVIIYYGPTITYTETWSENDIRLGIYDIEGDKICLKFLKGGNHCGNILKDDLGYYFGYYLQGRWVTYLLMPQ